MQHFIVALNKEKPPEEFKKEFNLKDMIPSLASAWDKFKKSTFDASIA